MFQEPHEINKQEHHTDKYYSPKLIVRRGQPFQIQVDFNRPYKPETDQFWLEYLIGRCLAKAVSCQQNEVEESFINWNTAVVNGWNFSYYDR